METRTFPQIVCGRVSTKFSPDTSFIQLMIDSMWYSTDEDSFGHHKGGPSSQLKGTTNGTGNTPAAPTSPGPPLLATPLLLTKDAAAHRSPPTLAANTSPRPQSTVRLSSQIIRVPPSPSDPSSPCGSEGEKSTLLLRLIDTPGFDLGADAIATASRERGLAGLTRLVEDRYEEMLREESKVVRRKARDEEGLIHLSECRRGLVVFSAFFQPVCPWPSTEISPLPH